jgi:hypothetical protein
VGSFDLTAGLIIELLFLKRLNLRFGQNQTIGSNLGFKGLDPILEIG